MRYRRATDHRALVLESIATAPSATRETVVADCVSDEFTRQMVLTMLNQMKREGLAQENVEKIFSLTTAGLDYLTLARFDRALPAPHERPKARKKK